jgi:hypothetical protein
VFLFVSRFWRGMTAAVRGFEWAYRLFFENPRLALVANDSDSWSTSDDC